jgi:hypothetical protein
MSIEIGTKVWQTNNPYMSTKSTTKPENEKTAEVPTKDANDKSELGVTYEKSDGYVTKKATYDINKKSASDRAAIVEQMKKASEDQRQSLIDMVEKMMSNQAGKSKVANGSLISGTVTEEARRKAAAEISEDGYWGVKQTSQRLFDFASALAGDDVEKMKKMQDAMNKGIGQAAAKLGGLPSIGQQTQDAANQLFKEYYESKGVEVDN